MFNLTEQFTNSFKNVLYTVATQLQKLEFFENSLG